MMVSDCRGGWRARAWLGLLAKLFGLCVLILSNVVLHARDKCSAEVKLLLSPTQTQAAVASLNFKKEESGRVYFYDTNNLDLLSQGLIIRLRQGASNDLTVKLRPQSGKNQFVPGDGGGFKCEVDVVDGAANPAYTVRINYAGGRVPETGTEVQELLNAGQQKLLKEAQILVDWPRVKRIADIQAKSWQSDHQPNFSRLALELWEWPGGRILELSAKVASDAGASAYEQLRQLANNRGLYLNDTQRAKTGIALEAFKARP